MSITKWLTGAKGDSAAVSQQLETALAELFLSLAPEIRAGRLGSIAVTSAEPREGRTRTALYLAETLADNLGEPVVLFDADSVQPSLHSAYGVERGAGTAELLAGEIELQEALRPTLREEQWFVTAGEGKLTVGDRVTRANIDRLMADVRSQFKVAVFDTGPLLAAQDAVVFCHSLAGTLLVTLAGETQGELLTRAHRLLERSQSRLLGVVINDPRGEFIRDQA